MLLKDQADLEADLEADLQVEQSSYEYAIRHDDPEHLEDYVSKRNINGKFLKGVPLLSCAARANSVRVAHFLITNGADINIKSEGNWTPLFYAIYERRLDMVRLLVNEGAQILAKDENGRTPLCMANNLNETEVASILIAKLDEHLFSAVECGSDGEVKEFLEGGANVEARNMDNQTPLHVASSKDSLPVLQSLLSRKPRLSVKDRNDNTPLHNAVERGNLEAIRLLLDKNVIYARDRFGMTPLHYAVFYNGKESIVGLLVSKGAELEAIDEKIKTPLHHAARKGNLNVAKLLLGHGARVDPEDYCGMTPLHYAFNFEMARLLINNGAEVCAIDGKIKTPLHYVAEKGNLDVAKLFLDHGARVDGVDCYGMAPLHYVAKQGNLDVAKLFLDHGARVDAKDHDGREPLYYALLFKRLGVAELLKGRSGTKFLSTWYHRFGSMCIKRAPILYRRERSSAIDHNALESSLELFNICKAEGIDEIHFNRNIDYLHENAYLYDVLLLQDEENQNTLLHVAIKENQLDFAKKLLCILNEPYCLNEVHRRKYFEGKEENEKPLSKVINTKNKYGEDVITLAIEGNNRRCILALFEYLTYENINRIKDAESGYTPLHEAVRSGSGNAVSALLKSGHVNVELMDKKSNKAFKYVNNQEIKELLLDYYNDQICSLSEKLARQNKRSVQIGCILYKTKLTFVFLAAFGSCFSIYEVFYKTEHKDVWSSSFTPYHFVCLLARSTGLILLFNHFIDLKLSEYKEEVSSLQKEVDSFTESRDNLENKLLNVQETISQDIRVDSRLSGRVSVFNASGIYSMSNK